MSELSAAHAVEERAFVCRACGCRRMAEVTGLGEGAQSFLNAAGTAAARARADARRDIDDTLSLAPCPACGRRSPHAKARWWWRKAGLPSVLILGVMLAFAVAPWVFDVDMAERDKTIAFWVVMGIAVLTLAVVLPLPVWQKWRSTTQRVRWK